MTTTTTTTTKTFKHTICVTDGAERLVFFCECNNGEAIERPYLKSSQMNAMEPIAYTSTGECPECGKEVSLHMKLFGRGLFAQEVLAEYAKVYDNGEKISLSYGLGTYTYNPSSNKMGYAKTRYRLTLNTKTGFLYSLSKGRVRNITYQTAQSDWLDNAVYKINSGLNSNVFSEFLDLCTERCGLKFIDEDRFVTSNKMHVLPLLWKFPVLENFPTYGLLKMPAQYRKPLSKMTKLNEVFELFIGTSAKTVRKELVSPKTIKLATELKELGLQTANLVKLLKAQNDYQNHRGIDSSSIHTIFPSSDDPFEQSSYAKVLEFALTHVCNGDETVLTNRIVSEMTRVYGTDKSISAAPTNTISLIRDTERMYTDLVAAIPNYEISYQGSFRKLHDKIMVEYNRLGQVNALIPYTESELKAYNSTIDGLEFRAAESTERLRDIGRQLNICVGSYSSVALRKSLDIVQVYVNGQYAVCLEIKDKDIVQAKTHYNRTPNEETATTIRQWAKAAGLSIATRDMTSHSCETLKETLRDAMPVEEAIKLLDADEAALRINTEGIQERRPDYHYEAAPVFLLQNRVPQQGAPQQLVAEDAAVAVRQPIADMGFDAFDDLPF